MNAFVVAFLASVGTGVVAAMNATQHATVTGFSRGCFVVLGAVIGAAIYGSAGWAAVKLARASTMTAVSVRNSASGFAGLALVLSAPFITWFVVTGIVGVLARSLGG